MSSHWLGQHGAQPANAGQIPVVTSILKDFSAEALGELRTWLEQNPPAISVENIIGYAQQTQASRARLAVSQSIANNVETTVTFDTKDFDYGGMWTAGSGARLTCQLKGKFLVGGSVVFAANATGIRAVHVRRNGTDYVASLQPVPGDATITTLLNISTPLDFTVGDYFELRVYQNSGGALNVVADIRTCIWATRVGP